MVNSEDKPTRIPDELRQRLKPFVDKREDLLNQSVKVLGLSGRVENVLNRHHGRYRIHPDKGYERIESSFDHTVRGIDRASDEELLKVKQLGPKGLRETRKKIAAYKTRHGL